MKPGGNSANQYQSVPISATMPPNRKAAWHRHSGVASGAVSGRCGDIGTRFDAGCESC